MAITCTGIDHIHFNTPDIRKFAGLMRALFDVEETRPGHFVPLEFINISMKMQHAAKDSPFLDIFEPTGIKGWTASEMMETGKGVSYISFRVVDIDAAAEHAKACGLTELSRVGFGEDMRQVQFDTLDLLGFRLEFVEYSENWDRICAENNARMDSGESVHGMVRVEL